MYIDFIKSDYKHVDESQREKYIKRDKNAYKNIIKNWIFENLDDIVDRKWEIPQLKYIIKDEEFFNLLKEAEMLYELGCYTSCIALVGIATEDFTKFIAEEFDFSELNSEVQYKRCNMLKEYGVISVEVHEILDKIRKIRNGCIHFNKNFKEKDTASLKKESLEVITLFKKLLEELLYENSDMDILEFSDKIIIESLEDKSKIKGYDEVKMLTRNIMQDIFEIDIQIEPDIDQLIMESHYKILEFDYKRELFSEMTMMDITNNLPVCVDLTKPDIERIEKLGIQEGDIIYAKIISQISDIGQTEEWKLLALDTRDFA